ncbi:hypothetical protein GOP47_0011892 [Adiantum capillus-veneris]|uniref:RING-type E3 ubiquitin transferase n=2 Tax=Adiantum capillus-veneris TaxID=13818 RepID=A0A9D4UTL5_ADICA|nr:hypothetical protein GOP47_0011892 [Adiantum capillus-veneris]
MNKGLRMLDCSELASLQSRGMDTWAAGSGSTSFSDESGRLREYRRVEPVYDAFVCPLTKTVMQDPVTLENGQTYERSAIERWFLECSANGRPPVCPMTQKELESTYSKPSIALRNTILEWTARNEAARLDNAKIYLTSEAPHDILDGLNDIQSLCLKNNINKLKARTSGLIPLIVDCLKREEKVRCSALATLRVLADDEDDNKEAIGETDAIRNCVKSLFRENLKEREEAVSLLQELSKSSHLCDKIVAINGAILMLVKTASSHSDNVITVQKADQILDNLESCDKSVHQMAENGRLHPLLRRLVEGSDDVRLEMAYILAELVLSAEGKAKAAEVGAKPLVRMLQSGLLQGREAALKCLCHLSDLDNNGPLLVEAGILGPLIEDLFAVGMNQLPMRLKEVSATTLANIVSSGVELEKVVVGTDGNTLISESTLHNFLHLVSNTGPAIAAKLLQVLVGLASSPKAVGQVLMAVESAGATISLIQFLEAPQKDLRANSVKLLYYLSPFMGNALADGLRITTGQLGTLVNFIGTSGVTEEQAAAAKLLANLPMEDKQLTQALLEEGALPTAINKLDELSQGFAQRGTSRFLAVYKGGLMGIILRFTYVSVNTTVVNSAQEHNLTSFFTKLLTSGNLEEVLRMSALGLANLSSYSKHLSLFPELPQRGSVCPCFFKGPSKPAGLCPVHEGICSAKETFCLLDAHALPLLVACLDHANVGVAEASLKALSTLVLDSGNAEKGVQVLRNADGIEPILEILREHRTEELRQLALMVLECMLRDEEIARLISTNHNVHTALIEAFKYGNSSTKQVAERALQHLNKIPSFSGVYSRRPK